jgi:hypothetical protein
MAQSVSALAGSCTSFATVRVAARSAASSASPPHRKPITFRPDMQTDHPTAGPAGLARPATPADRSPSRPEPAGLSRPHRTFTTRTSARSKPSAARRNGAAPTGSSSDRHAFPEPLPPSHATPSRSGWAYPAVVSEFGLAGRSCEVPAAELTTGLSRVLTADTMAGRPGGGPAVTRPDTTQARTVVRSGPECRVYSDLRTHKVSSRTAA